MIDPSQIINQTFPIWQLLPPRPRPVVLYPSSDKPTLFPATRIPNPNRMNRKYKNAAEKRKRLPTARTSSIGEFPGYRPPSLNDLQFQNRVIAHRLYPKKTKFVNNRFAPYAPRNTTSFIIRSKKSGGVASLSSVSPVTPAVLPTPKFSPSREGLVDMAKEEWGVDGYGSMKGLIRLRSGQKEEDESSDSEVEEHLEVDKRLDHDLSRFEMVYPSFGEDQGAAAAYVMENRIEDREARIVKLEEENLTLKERVFLIEREMSELQMRLTKLENINSNHGNGNNNDDVGVINLDDNEQEHSYSGDGNVNLDGSELWDNVGVSSGEKNGVEINQNLM